MPVRTEYLDALVVLRRFLEATAQRWDAPSALAEMTVGDLAGHAARAAFTVDRYLIVAEPATGGAIDAAGYFLALPELGGEIDSAFHRSIRERSSAEATGGPAALLGRFDAAAAQLATSLPAEPPQRTLEVLDGMTVRLDDYLVTRLVEIVVHGDDLAASLDVPAPVFASGAMRTVIDCLVEVAVRTHGDMAVVRALTRRERDVVQALRVL